jgi:hypothetical protein
MPCGGLYPLSGGSLTNNFCIWYPPRDLSVESILNRKSKILSSPEFIRGVASKIENRKSKIENRLSLLAEVDRSFRVQEPIAIGQRQTQWNVR